LGPGRPRLMKDPTLDNKHLEKQWRNSLPPAVEPREHFAGVDLLRLGSVCMIVWFHLGGPGKSIAYVGLPALLLITTALPVVHENQEPLRSLLARRARRLLEPWVFWSIVYGLVMLISAGRRNRTGEGFHLSMLLGGTSVHLWYLPYAVLASTLAIVTFRYARGRETWAFMLACLAFAVAAIRFAELPVPLPFPFAQWWFALPSIPAGLAIGAAVRCSGQRTRRLLTTALAFAAAGVAIGTPDSMTYAGGYVLTCLAFLWNPTPGRWVQGATALSLGIYILHPLIFSLVVWRVTRSGSPVTAFVLTLALSALLASLLRMTPLRRFV
jgi:surface polysaccharide O-acyltransferase-like enzyme